MSNIAPLQKMMVEAIQDPIASSQVIAELADAVAADVRYSMTFAAQKGRVAGEELLQLLEAYEGVVNACQEAWSQYAKEHSSVGENDFLQKLRDLQDVLRRQLAILER